MRQKRVNRSAVKDTRTDNYLRSGVAPQFFAKRNQFVRRLAVPS